MALIKCIKCGETYSDSLSKCPHCEFEPRIFLCPECGSLVGVNDSKCFFCGYEHNNQNIKPADLEFVKNQASLIKEKIETETGITKLERIRHEIELISAYEDVEEIKELCDTRLARMKEIEHIEEIYKKACLIAENGYGVSSDELEGLLVELRQVKDYKGISKILPQIEEKCVESKYSEAVELFAKASTTEEYNTVIKIFEDLGSYKDSDEYIQRSNVALKDIDVKTMQKKKKSKLIISVIAAAIAVIAAIVIIVMFVIVPSSKYNAAKELMDAGQYEEAIFAFDEMDGYKDSNEQIETCQNLLIEEKYNEALITKNNGQYEEAVSAFTKLNGYKDSNEQITICQDLLNEERYTMACEYINEHKYEEAKEILETIIGYKDSKTIYERLLIRNAQIGDSVYFGTYEQDNNIGNGQEEIEWIVLKKEPEKVMVMSKFGLDSVPYNTEGEPVTWETSTLREWLNNEFANKAFTEEERGLIETTEVKTAGNELIFGYHGQNVWGSCKTYDNIFLLSSEDAEELSDSIRRCSQTEYSKTKGENYGTTHRSWWLRSPGYEVFYAAYVTENGYVDKNGCSVKFTINLVRPVMWININFSK